MLKKLATDKSTAPRFLRASDNASKCMMLLREYVLESGEGCVFADINDRLIADALQDLNDMEPQEDMSKEFQIECLDLYCLLPRPPKAYPGILWNRILYHEKDGFRSGGIKSKKVRS